MLLTAKNTRLKDFHKISKGLESFSEAWWYQTYSYSSDNTMKGQRELNPQLGNIAEIITIYVSMMKAEFSRSIDIFLLLEISKNQRPHQIITIPFGEVDNPVKLLEENIFSQIL